MRVALLHLRDERPDAPGLNDTLRLLTRASALAVESLGWEPVVVASGDVGLDATLRAAEAADVVVLLGGEDVHPAFYAGPDRYPEDGGWDIRADAAQLAVVLAALRSGQPLRGLCRGLQVINVAFGGGIVQHLGTPGGHRAAGDGMASFTRITPRLLPGTDLADDVVPGPVLCSHHQAVGALGAGLVTAARADDGVVEAVVHESAPITGVQWHPEHPDVAQTQLTRLLLRLQRQRDDSGRL